MQEKGYVLMQKDKDLTNGGFTQKEMLVMLIEGQTELDKRIDLLHEKVNTKLSRQELSRCFCTRSVSQHTHVINTRKGVT